MAPIFVSTTSLSPNSAQVGGPDQLVTVTGTGFVPGATVQWNGGTLVPTSVDPTGFSLTVTVPAACTATVGAYYVTVVNPGNGVSNPQVFYVTQTTASVSGVASVPSTGLPTSLTVASTPGLTAVTSAGGSGTLTVATYSANPTSVAPPSTATYYDVNTSRGNSFTTVTITVCTLAGNILYWFDPTPPVPQWRTVIPQTYDQTTGCITATVSSSSTSSPTTLQLTGTLFAAVTTDDVGRHDGGGHDGRDQAQHGHQNRGGSRDGDRTTG